MLLYSETKSWQLYVTIWRIVGIGDWYIMRPLDYILFRFDLAIMPFFYLLHTILSSLYRLYKSMNVLWYSVWVVLPQEEPKDLVSSSFSRVLMKSELLTRGLSHLMCHHRRWVPAGLKFHILKGTNFSASAQGHQALLHTITKECSEIEGH